MALSNGFGIYIANGRLKEAIITPNLPDPARENELRAVVENIVARLEKVEAHLGIQADKSPPLSKEESCEINPPPDAPPHAYNEDSLEYQIGQTWFALIGIVVLAIGFGFVLSLPFEGLPQIVPPLGGFLLSGIVFAMGRVARQGFQIISKYLRGAGMLLLFFSTLRLFFFGDPPLIPEIGLVGRFILTLVLVINLTLAWRRESLHLFILALITGYGSALVVGSVGYLLGILTLLAFVVLYVQLARNWRHLAPIAFSLTMATYVIWAIGNPLLGNPVAIRSDVAAPVYFILFWILVFTLVLMLRRNLGKEDAPLQMTGALICILGFLIFFLHNLFAFNQTFLVSHLAASALFISLAFVFWIREHSWFSTFMYVMTGYMALSLALIKAFAIPEVFVALSLQSLVVIASAIYFRSRFIIVANCLIFLGIISGYLALADAEQGMSIGFGVVALISARVLNWKKDRLALKTELMRNTYLVIAFLVFPYALYYLVPEAYVAVALVGLSLFYYGMNLVVRSRKYRWMGHSTLLLTVAYVMVVGVSRLEGNYRIVSFLVLGSIMLVVSVVFTQIRSRGKGQSQEGKDRE